MRLAYSELVDFEILPVGIGQQAAINGAARIARNNSKSLSPKVAL